MRVLLANEARSGAGGVETYLASVADALRSRGHEVALAYANPSAESGPITVATSQSWSVGDVGLADVIARARAWAPDVCYSHNMGDLAVDEALAGVAPLVKMMHGYFGTCVSGQKTREFPGVAPCPRLCGPGCLVQYLPRRCGPRRPLVIVAQYRWAARQRALFDRYRAVAVASGHMRDEYVRHGVSSSRVHVLPMFVSDAAAPAEAAKTVDAVFMGRITRLKGADRAIRAAARASRALGRPVRTVIAGDGPQRSDVARLARKLGVDAAFPGWISAAERDRLLASARVAIVPSVWPEPFGLVGLEAASAGVPAVAFAVGGIPEWLTHEVNGLLVEPRLGADGLGDALARLLGDETLRARLGAGARALKERFNANAHVAALDRIFNHVRHQ